MVDGSEAFSGDDQRIWEAVRGLPVVLAVNKMDLGCRRTVPEEVGGPGVRWSRVSALFGTHVDELWERSAQSGRSGPARESWTA